MDGDDAANGSRETRRRGGLRPRWIVGGLAGAMLIGMPAVLLGGSPSSQAAIASSLPVFPNNLVVFPNRDFVTLEGYSGYVGMKGLVEVTRPGVGVIGSATGTVSGTDVAFEVNHPGGYCWGAGGGLNITPDIRPGDVVSLKIAAGNGLPEIHDVTTVLDVAADDAVQTDNTVTVTGRLGDGVDPANFEQRIIEPALRDLVGKRDVRALPGPMTPAPKGGYSSGVVVDEGANKFTATYIFDTLEAATVAANAGLGERAMAWEFVDADANRQGLTIAENGEPGGPGFGGCPAGPLQAGPPAPTGVSAVAVSGGVKVSWTPATALPGTPAILGYRVRAVQKVGSNSEHLEFGKRIMNPAASSTTLTGFSLADYDIELMSISSVGETNPPVSPVIDGTPPVVSASPRGGSGFAVPQTVTLTADDPNADIYYLLDDGNLLDGDQLADNAAIVRYTAPFTISTDTSLKFVAFDPSNNVSIVGQEQYSFTTDPVAKATTIVSGTSSAAGAVSLNWQAADPGAPGLTITGYEIDVFDSAAATNRLRTEAVTGPVTTKDMTGLPGDAPLWFVVRAKNSLNSVFGPDSPLYGPVTTLGDVVADAGPDQVGVVRNTTVNLVGTGSSGQTFLWTQLVNDTTTPMPAGVDKVTILTPTAKNASFVLPLYAFPMKNQKLTFQLTVTGNGVTKTDTVIITPKSDTVTVSSAKWKRGDFRVVGTASTPGATVTIRNASGVLGTALVDNLGAFSYRDRTNNLVNNPGPIFVDSDRGGTAGPVTVVNG